MQPQHLTNACASARVRRRWASAAQRAIYHLSLALGSLIMTTSVWAQTAHLIPQDAREGRIIAKQFPVVEIDGDLYRLAPGARIFSLKKRTITPIHLPPKAKVKYLLDRNGQVKMIWLVGEQP